MRKGFSLSIFVLLTIVPDMLADFGSCPGVKGMESFHPAGHTGRWYDFAKTKGISDGNDKCSYYDICFQAEGFYSVVYTYFLFNTRHAETWLTSIKNSYMPNSTEARTPVMVATDYSSYAVLYNCDEHFAGATHEDEIFILTRQRHPSDEVVKRVYEVLDGLAVSQSEISEVDQFNCPTLTD